MIASGTVGRMPDATEFTRLRGTKKLDKSLLSVIVPIFNEEATLPELARRLPRALEGLGFRAIEILLVSDGSRDDSERMIREIVELDPRFQGIFLTRNFGHQAAVSIGMSQARGTVVAVIDGDLQDPPEAIGSLVAALAQGNDVAYGVRTKRKEGVLLRWAYFTFYRLLRFVSMIDVPLDSGGVCASRRRVRAGGPVCRRPQVHAAQKPRAGLRRAVLVHETAGAVHPGCGLYIIIRGNHDRDGLSRLVARRAAPVSSGFCQPDHLDLVLRRNPDAVPGDRR
jgi:glycosyltransferase involved in cell wall biosynthesis